VDLLLCANAETTLICVIVAHADFIFTHENTRVPGVFKEMNHAEGMKLPIVRIWSINAHWSNTYLRQFVSHWILWAII
jgi:hypothetical protein